MIILHQNASSYKLHVVLGYNQIRKTPEGHQAPSFMKLNSGARQHEHAPERKSVNNVNNNYFSSSLSDQSDTDHKSLIIHFDFSDKCNLNGQNGSKYIYICQLDLIILKLQHL